MRKLYYAEIVLDGNIVRKVIGEDLLKLSDIAKVWRDNYDSPNLELIRYFREETKEVEKLSKQNSL